MKQNKTSKKKKNPQKQKQNHKTKTQMKETLGALLDSYTGVHDRVPTDNNKPDRKRRAILAVEAFLEMKRGN